MNRWETIAEVNYLLVKTTLTNISPDTISYYRMSCSWPEDYFTSAKELIIYIPDCLNNIPNLIKIPTHKEQESILKLISRKSINQLHDTKFKDGFYFESEQDENDLFQKIHQVYNTNKDFKTKVKPHTTAFWSDTLFIK